MICPDPLVIVTSGDILDTVCQEVIGPIPDRFIAEMRSLMVSSGGVGIAAPQVGIALRFFLMGDELVINPSNIEVSSQQSKTMEGCLSIPGITLTVSRPTSVRATWFDGTNFTTRLLIGDEARVFLHELDHLNGVMITTRFAELFSKFLPQYKIMEEQPNDLVHVPN